MAIRLNCFFVKQWVSKKFCMLFGIVDCKLCHYGVKLAGAFLIIIGIFNLLHHELKYYALSILYFSIYRGQDLLFSLAQWASSSHSISANISPKTPIYEKIYGRTAAQSSIKHPESNRPGGSWFRVLQFLLQHHQSSNGRAESLCVQV